VELIKKTFFSFIEEYGHGDPFLLALSGGPDSMALYTLLLESKYPFEVAHVHHGWRKESDMEASQLAEMCSHDHIPFHFKKIQAPSSNWEDESRNRRLQFFKELILNKKYEGLLMAHHADDLAETVLKRIFEGASLPKLKGLSKRSEVDGMTIYRPLLELRKKEILHFLQTRRVPYFEDPTNLSDQFLRGRFRKEIFPYLTENFGKEVVSSLCRLGLHSSELDDFCHEFVRPWSEKIKREESALTIDLSGVSMHTDFGWKLIVRHFFEKERITISHPLLNSIVAHLKKKSRCKELRIGEKILKIDQGVLKLLL
jgi:tRNA(Ile)-lysidine synthase